MKRKIKDGDIEIYQKNKLQRAYRRMPWYMAPKKDVTSCEKLWGAANERRSADIRMRELITSNVVIHIYESIVYSEGTWGTETSKYPEEKKEKSIP